MSGKFSILRALRQAFCIAPFEEVTTGYTAMMAKAPLPAPVLQTIKAFETNKGWQWKGEYSRATEEGEEVFSVLLYTRSGGWRAVRLRPGGEVIDIAPGNPFFLYQALSMSDYYLSL